MKIHKFIAIYGRYSAWKESIFIYLSLEELWGTVLEQYTIKRNLMFQRKWDNMVKITEESFLFSCGNSQSVKVNRCHLLILNNGMSFTLFFPLLPDDCLCFLTGLMPAFGGHFVCPLEGLITGKFWPFVRNTSIPKTTLTYWILMFFSFFSCVYFMKYSDK